MSLRDRLRSLQGTGRAAPADAAPADTLADVAPAAAADAPAADSAPSPASVRGQAAGGLGRPRRDDPFPGQLDALLRGRVHETPHGVCYVVERRYPLSHAHGAHTLATGASGAWQDGLLALARTPAERAHVRGADPRRFVYLDTETTGLAGGTGTYAFLVGCARYEDDAFVVRQFFLRTLAEEHALLHGVAGALAGCEVLVTYNGKAFDWPLLETRYALARRGGPRGPQAPPVHLDLLFASRRLWRTRLTACGLGEVERHALGVERGADTPGWLIPQLYFAYLRERDVRPLVGVFRHNALDLLSLAGLLGRIGALRLPGAPDGEATAIAVDELLALGRCCAEDGDLARALAALQSALALAEAAAPSALHQRLADDAHWRIGATLRRLGRATEAVPHWRALAARAPSPREPVDVRPFEALAKHCEHALRDPTAARDWTLRALAALDAPGAVPAPRTRADLRHRLARLERAIGVSGATCPTDSLGRLPTQRRETTLPQS
ncbi:MAG TPA: ribonuclease H-like domain-containing protein [Ktedonobacterales bacterium]|nr:ribonuclease H-like domain-containing protein [Ktedonobacterales bacterium]